VVWEWYGACSFRSRDPTCEEIDVDIMMCVKRVPVCMR